MEGINADASAYLLGVADLYSTYWNLYITLIPIQPEILISSLLNQPL
jgi:hypothetical protein